MSVLYSLVNAASVVDSVLRVERRSGLAEVCGSACGGGVGVDSTAVPTRLELTEVDDQVGGGFRQR